MKHLIALTNSGHSVACSIHQPRQEIFASFDKIMLMSEGRQVRCICNCVCVTGCQGAHVLLKAV